MLASDRAIDPPILLKQRRTNTKAGPLRLRSGQAFDSAEVRFAQYDKFMVLQVFRTGKLIDILHFIRVNISIVQPMNPTALPTPISAHQRPSHPMGSSKKATQ